MCTILGRSNEAKIVHLCACHICVPSGVQLHQLQKDWTKRIQRFRKNLLKVQLVLLDLYYFHYRFPDHHGPDTIRVHQDHAIEQE